MKYKLRLIWSAIGGKVICHTTWDWLVAAPLQLGGSVAYEIHINKS